MARALSGLVQRWLVVAILIALFPASARAADPNTDGSDVSRKIEKQTFELINQYRAKEDLPALKWNDGMAELARAHSRDMATGAADFGHGGFSDRVDHLKGLVAGFRGAGENVAELDRLADAPARAVDLWLHSPHHLKNIRGDYSQSGLGVWLARDGTVYFTQIFLKTVEPGSN